MSGRLFLLLLVAAITGCGPPNEPVWVERCVPTTDQERKLIAEHAEKILSPPPANVQGDPDWDDVVYAAHDEARKLYCRPTLWERWNGGGWDANWRDTGRWKYVDKDASK